LAYRWIRLAGMALRHGPRLVARLPQAWRVFRKAGWRGVDWELRRRVRPAADYARWAQVHDTLTPQARQAMVARVAAMPSPPRIAVLMPTYNPDPRWFQAAIDSVRAQIYPHWELCIADDASTAPHVRALLERCAAWCSVRRTGTSLRPPTVHWKSSPHRGSR